MLKEKKRFIVTSQSRKYSKGKFRTKTKKKNLKKQILVNVVIVLNQNLPNAVKTGKFVIILR